MPISMAILAEVEFSSLNPPSCNVGVRLAEQSIEGQSRGINIPRLNPPLFPAALWFAYALHRVSAGVRTAVLQGTSPLACESVVTAGPIAGLFEKNLSE